ncbi:ArsR/SmtB family transcription factor [Parvularcula maris]|uniref:Helix-turn-helix domain-containing protein n=1 Tax=Parvularcula maris TaxID=2965077 RepID=A0A9X2L809_9PROT|nr:helix-turn-helix domain-containing protein [Parvularcula maris]MCQ8183847.1 helix-turn-helix domain-containing protein [Parvularcula maris]
MPAPITHPKIEDVPLAAVLHALSDPVRLSIVALAAEEDGLPCRAFETAIPKSTMSHHWRILREAGIIRQEGRGTSRINSLRREELDARFPGLLGNVLEQYRRESP